MYLYVRTLMKTMVVFLMFNDPFLYWTLATPGDYGTPASDPSSTFHPKRCPLKNVVLNIHHEDNRVINQNFTNIRNPTIYQGTFSTTRKHTQAPFADVSSPYGQRSRNVIPTEERNPSSINRTPNRINEDVTQPQSRSLPPTSPYDSTFSSFPSYSTRGIDAEHPSVSSWNPQQRTGSYDGGKSLVDRTLDGQQAQQPMYPTAQHENQQVEPLRYSSRSSFNLPESTELSKYTPLRNVARQETEETERNSFPLRSPIINNQIFIGGDGIRTSSERNHGLSSAESEVYEKRPSSYISSRQPEVRTEELSSPWYPSRPWTSYSTPRAEDREDREPFHSFSISPRRSPATMNEALPSFSSQNLKPMAPFTSFKDEDLSRRTPYTSTSSTERNDEPSFPSFSPVYKPRPSTLGGDYLGLGSPNVEAEERRFPTKLNPMTNYQSEESAYGRSSNRNTPLPDLGVGNEENEDEEEEEDPLDAEEYENLSHLDSKCPPSSRSSPFPHALGNEDPTMSPKPRPSNDLTPMNENEKKTFPTTSSTCSSKNCCTCQQPLPPSPPFLSSSSSSLLEKGGLPIRHFNNHPLGKLGEQGFLKDPREDTRMNINPQLQGSESNSRNDVEIAGLMSESNEGKKMGSFSIHPVVSFLMMGSVVYFIFCF
ncbi:hypothetical protein HMI56_001442 [Coelomomyces lativittatus]|nr:hypothetical protein HMI56_001442 [Coelomomyces lativittatus]